MNSSSHARGLRFSGFAPVALAAALAAPVLTSAGAAHAAINLELRPSFQSTFLGNVVSVDLYAVSDTPAAQFTAGVEVILNWDTTFLTLLGDDVTGSPMSASPRLTTDPWHFNDSLTDGDAMWIGFAPPGSPVAATAAGTFLASFDFLAIAVTTPTTLVSIPVSDVPNTGSWPSRQTVVADPVIPNTNIVGTLSGATIQINIPAPGALLTLLGGLALARGRRRG